MKEIENRRLIDKCENIKRTMVNLKHEIQLCRATNRQVFCAGFSDGCEYPSEFKSASGRPLNKIDFSSVKPIRWED